MIEGVFMEEGEYQLLTDLIRREFGILVKGDKRMTLHSRISHRLALLDLKNYTEYCTFLSSDATGQELHTLASHITNNETYFFREKSQLDVFPELLVDIKRERARKGQNTVRILSLASSTGEEVYSLNIILQESGLFLWGWDVSVTGVDIDRSAIRRARDASYPASSFRAVNGNAKLIQKYFSVSEDRYLLKKGVMQNVSFRQGNLLDPASFDGLEDADIIFCRNVLMYMSDEGIDKIVANMHRCLSDSGYLFVGSSESLIQRTNLFVPEYRGGVIVYRKNRDG